MYQCIESDFLLIMFVTTKFFIVIIVVYMYRLKLLFLHEIDLRVYTIKSEITTHYAVVTNHAWASALI